MFLSIVKNGMKIYWIYIEILLIVLLFVACYREKQNTEYIVPIPNLRGLSTSPSGDAKIKLQEESLPPIIEDVLSESTSHPLLDDLSENNEGVSKKKSLEAFPSSFSDILNWGAVRFSQKNSTIKNVLAENTGEYNIQALSQSVQTKKNRAFDVAIGDLQDLYTQDGVNKKILETIQSFMRDFQSGVIDTTLQKYVVADVVEIISRKIARNREYVRFITEYRIGKIEHGDENERYAKIRIFAQSKQFLSQIVLLMYFEKKENSDEWSIIAIEGEFNDLLEPYLSQGIFLPSGTLGLTQNF